MKHSQSGSAVVHFNLVGSAPNPHSNQTNSPSQGAGLVSTESTGGYPIKSSLTLSVPENVNIDRFLLEKPPEFRFQRDCFVYILHLVTSIPSRKRDILDKHDGFTPINRKLLQKRIRSYKKHIEYLKAVGVLIERNVYCPGKYSMGLKFSPRFESKLIPVEITKWTLIKSIVYKHKTYNVELTDELSYLKEWFNDKIEVNFQGGLSHLNELLRQESANPNVTNERLRYNCRLLPLLKLRNKEYAFYVDNTGFRLHTSITQMMSSLRRFIRYDGKRLCAVDIKNSQLYLTIGLLDDETFINNNIDDMITNPKLINRRDYPIMVVKKIRMVKNKPDVIRFKKYVSEGKFYEFFGEALLKNELVEDRPKDELREMAKSCTFSSIYSSNRSINRKESIKLFKRLFPNVYEIYRLIKKGDNMHPALSICLQRFEADLVLHDACRIISDNRPEIPIFTLHDSIITTEDNVEYVEMVLSNVLEKRIGFKPPLKQEKWWDD